MIILFLTFFLSLSFSFINKSKLDYFIMLKIYHTPSSLINNGAALGRIVRVAALFWTLISTITLIPFHFAVSLAKSSPIFLAFYSKFP